MAEFQYYNQLDLGAKNKTETKLRYESRMMVLNQELVSKPNCTTLRFEKKKKNISPNTK